MNRFIQSTDATVLFRMSDNAEYYREGKGIFEVRYQRSEARLFPTLLEAFLFYYTVEEEAELWDKTGKPLMIESKIMLHLN
jgi:hypothetical protein